MVSSRSQGLRFCVDRFGMVWVHLFPGVKLQALHVIRPLREEPGLSYLKIGRP